MSIKHLSRWFCSSVLLLMGLLPLTVRAQEANTLTFSVSLMPVMIDEDAYQNPDITGLYRRSADQYGLLDIVISKVIDGVSASYDQTDFNTKNELIFPQIRSVLSSAFTTDLTSHILTALVNNDMIKGTVRDDAGNHINLKVLKYGLLRSDTSTTSSPKMLLFSKSEMQLLGADGKKILSRNLTTYSDRVDDMQAYVNNNSVMTAAVQQIQEKLANQIAVELYAHSLKNN